MASSATRMQREPEKTVAIVCPTEGEIAAVAYRMWVDNGCPVGSDLEDWFRAEEMLKNPLVSKCEDLSSPRTAPCIDTFIESEILVECQLEGHWEVWEREWEGAHWVWDSGRPKH